MNARAHHREEQLARALAKAAVSEHGAILGYTADGDALEFRAAWGTAAETLLGDALPVPFRSIAGRAAQKRRPIEVRDARSDRNHFHIVDRLTGVASTQMVALPICGAGGQCEQPLVVELLQPSPDFVPDDLKGILAQHGFTGLGWGAGKDL